MQPVSEVPENFLFAIITSNPLKDNVRVVIDDGTIKFVMKRDKFAKIIEDLCGYETRVKVEMVMREFGETYVLDRTESTLTHLKPEEVDDFSITKIGKDTAEITKRARADAKGPFTYDERLKKEYEDHLSATFPRKNPLTPGFVDYRKKP